jgi:hypothetical protein
MNMKRVLPVVLLMAFLLVLPVQAQSLPWVEVWVMVRDGVTGAVLDDAQVENPLCEGLPADACTRYGVWNGDRQAFILKVPRLEPYEVVVSKDGYGTQVRSGTAVDAVTTWDVRLFPAQSGRIFRVYLPLIMNGGTPPPPAVYNPTAAVGRLNWWRSLAGVPAVSGNLELHSGCRAHARWMVNNGVAAHTEDPALPGYTMEGDACGQAANLAFGVDVFPSDEQAVDALLASPFHALLALDPRLGEIGFGSARLDTFWTGTYAAAALDVFRGLDYSRSGTQTFFPRPNGTLPVLSYTGLAQPDPLTACPGYAAPTGAALLALYLPYPPGTLVSTELRQGSTLLAHCVIHAASYTHPNLQLQQQGRSALAERGALMIIPRYPLQPNTAYTARLTYSGGQIVQWSFNTSAAPLAFVPMQVLLPHGD